MNDIVLANHGFGELGKVSSYEDNYNPQRLVTIDRKTKRQEIGIDPDCLPFHGLDYWNHYEVSWLNEKGKPIVAVAQIIYNCNSLKLIESKSLKLYFNSFNNTVFKDSETVKFTIKKDLEACLQTEVSIIIYSLNQARIFMMPENFAGECLDNLDIECSVYHPHPEFLTTFNENVEECLYSDLLKSNCLITNQPDWGSVQVRYKGNRINRAQLLKYFISFRNHNEFHEQCIERIFVDIMNYCKPQQLTVYGRYTRRGGIDINPLRTTEPNIFKSIRLVRQ